MFKVKMASSGFFSISPTLEPIPQAIKEYFDVYCQRNLQKLCAELGNTPTRLLIMSENTEASLASITDPDLKAIYQVLRRLITGSLTKSEPLMRNLRRVDGKIPMVDLNKIISVEISAHITRFFDGIRTSPRPTPLSRLLPIFM